ncbi:AAA family ATPase [Flavobacteriaceae bacterium]|nr:AAA family ATPase [Flavobacteriaceae bacterium]
MSDPISLEHIMDSLKMNFLFNMRTGDPFIDMIMSSLIAVGISIIFSQWTNISNGLSFKNSMGWLNDRYYSTITIEGKRTFRNNSWSVRTNNIWGKRFDAIWDYINSESNYNGINRLKEMMDNTDSDTYENKNKNRIDKDIYVVDANCRAFPLNKEKTVFVKVNFSDNTGDSDKMIEMCGKVDTIKIEIYSHILSIMDLKNYVDNLTLIYLKKIEEHRKGKIFIYSLQSSTSDDEGNNKNWMERPFRSTRKFDNLYFDGKNDLIEKIDFFTNNKEWYEKEGHPYTLGIGLSGSPGTGKTSVIKCLANKLKRHLIQIPLNKVKNEADFYRYYFESTYSSSNVSNSVDFENKIIVLEDIDCMSDIILDRSNKNPIDISNNENEFVMLENIVNAVSIVSDDKKSTCKSPFQKEEKMTLSFILNLIDGLDENYGRILIITSNYYDKIDPALIRPGRIDLKIEMKKASIQTIKDMYCHYYENKIPNKYIRRLKDDCISPAELVNYYRTTKTSKDFLDVIVNKCNQSDYEQ